MTASDTLTRMFVAKDFKGKGLANERRAVASELARVIDQMTALVGETEQVLASTPFRLRYAQLSGKHREPYHVMRWRFQTIGTPWASWEEVCAAATAYPDVVRQRLLRFELERISLLQAAKALRTLHGLLAEGSGMMDQARHDMNSSGSYVPAGP